MELYTSDIEEVLTKTMLKPNYLEHLKSLTDIVYEQLTLAEAFELSRFTFEKVRLRCEEPQEDELDIKIDFVQKRDLIDLILSQVETNSALQCQSLMLSEQKLVEKYGTSLNALTQLEQDLSDVNLKSQREQVSKQIVALSTL